MLLVLLLSSGACAFQNLPAGTPPRTARFAGDPTKVWYADVANAVQNVLTNSPLNEGKKALVKLLAGPYDQAATRARLEKLIADENAKQCLDAKGVRYVVVELDAEADGRALRAELGQLVDRTSVPAIWIKGDFVGGCNDGPGLLTLESQGKLDGMLQAAGAL
ncbi:hypothetical protein CTAYLR_004629 [Chrysophaeum taylorii]|uniref:Glutaredoxin domain-containing protein n=1 Tax=Chrysophaeum taylorii TaxID=2483200 RepID=A0AAD7UNV2_9STRA|nr:hypothetical protein CTAYLR_004629 [Chrysophaeum taylorii]